MVPQIRAAIIVAFILGAVAVPGAAQPQQGDFRMGASLDPTLVSVDVSQQTFGDATVGTLLVGRNDVFADNLGGAALAGTLGGPLLLTDGGEQSPLRPEVLQEINRVLDPTGAGGNCDEAPTDVYILGGESAVSAAAEEEVRIQGWCVTRLQGGSRVETSVAVAQVIESLSGGNIEALVARSDVFADSASGGAYAGRFGRPILVTQGDVLHPEVRDYLYARDITFFDRVRLLGGTAALSQAVEDELRAVSPNPEGISRVAGATRDGTAVAIANLYLMSSAGGVGSVAISNGFADDGWVYALTGGATSWVYDAPMLYVQAEFVPEDPYVYLFDNQPGQIITVGPVERVSDSTMGDARAIANHEVD